MRRSKKSREIHENLNKSKSIIKLMLFFLIVLGVGIGLLIFRNTKLLFNDINDAEREKITTAINEYVEKKCDEENPSKASKCFSANKVYLVERIIDNDNELDKKYKDYDYYYYAYSWVVQGNYIKVINKVEEDSGSSIPNKVLMGKKGDKYTALDNQIPGDGTKYAEDMKKLFPSKIRNKMNNASVDGTVTKLIEENNKKAEEYYK